MVLFQDRKDAGLQLAKRLQSYKNHEDTIVLGLPRGGVVLAYEIAKQLHVPIDILVSRKISVPGNPEAALGAITVDGHKVLDTKFIEEFGIKSDYLDREIKKEQEEAERRLKAYRAGRLSLNLKNKKVIVVDDGVATGATLRVSLKSVRAHEPQEIIVAIPVAPAGFLTKIRDQCDKIICLHTPSYFVSVGSHYKSFDQVTDAEVIELMGLK